MASILASFYFKSATEKNTNLLKLHDTTIIHVDALRNALWRTDKSLYELLSDSAKVYEDKIRFLFKDVIVKLNSFSEIDYIEKIRILRYVNNMILIQKSLNA